MTFGADEMIRWDHKANCRISFQCFWIAIALFVVGPIASQAKAEEFDGPSFRKGVWHFVRTLEVVLGKNNRHRILEREMTRCVDPTQAMRATFSSPSVGNC